MASELGFEDYKYEGNQIPMEEIRVLHLAVGTQIPAVRNATFKIFTPGLVENREKIECIQPITETYGSHARHKLDVYEAKEDEGPILVFFYGGGMIRGDKQLQGLGSGLVYHNLGTFFASRGITTVIPDYRRVNSPKGGEGAVFPSGGEDVSLVLKWLETSRILKDRKRDVVLLGNSAGGAHVATFLFEESFLEQRRGFVEGGQGLLNGAKDYVLGSAGITLKGAVLLGVPAHFQNAAKGRKDAPREYYGSEEKAATNCPVGLLEKLSQSSISHEKTYIPPLLTLVGEYDPPDEIADPMTDLLELFNTTFPDNTIKSKILKGHNHISPPLALMSGDEKGEEWGEELITWILGHPSHVYPSAVEIPRGPKKGNKKHVTSDERTIEANGTDHHRSSKWINKPLNPSEDSSTRSPGTDKHARPLDPSEDTSTREAAKQDSRNGEDAVENPAEDFSTEFEKKKKPADPSKDSTTEEAERIFGHKEPFSLDQRPKNPAVDESTRDAGAVVG